MPFCQVHKYWLKAWWQHVLMDVIKQAYGKLKSSDDRLKFLQRNFGPFLSYSKTLRVSRKKHPSPFGCQKLDIKKQVNLSEHFHSHLWKRTGHVLLAQLAHIKVSMMAGDRWRPSWLQRENEDSQRSNKVKPLRASGQWKEELAMCWRSTWHPESTEYGLILPGRKKKVF